MSYLDWDTSGTRLQRRRRYNLLDNVDSQASSSKPTVRSDGSALVAGDRWLDTGDRIWWYWNGVYWLSEQICHSNTGIASVATTAGVGIFSVPSAYNLFLLDFHLSFRVNITGNALDSTNYWTASLLRMTANGEVSDVDFLLNSYSLGQRIRLSTTLNTYRDVSALSILGYQFQLVINNTPASLTRPSVTLRYRQAKP